MARIRSMLILALIFAVAVHLVWDDIAPMVPYVIWGLLGVMVVGALYFRKRW